MFQLSEHAIDIFDSIDGFLIIDKNADVVYMREDLAVECGYDSAADCVGKPITEIIPYNTTSRVLETGKKQIGEIYMVEGYTVVCNAYPIFHNGELIGALELDAFQDTTQVYTFLDGLVEGNHDYIYYKNELQNAKTAKYSIDDIIGSSPAAAELKNTIRFAAKSNSTKLIEGETGCGKELVAHSIHSLSTRSFKNFVRINCAAIPEQLFESELFGYEEGSFTGAKKGGRKGKAELANGGTLFLDEINQLPFSLQPKLLRFIQEKEILRVGGDFAIPVDVHIIASTNENLLEMVKNKTFREDLYYRLNVINIEVPPLRERKSDIPELVYDFMKGLNSSLGKVVHQVSHVDNEIFELLCQYDWPGNVRELHNVVERAMNRCIGESLHMEHFQDFINRFIPAPSTPKVKTGGLVTLEEAKRQAEIDTILSTLKFYKSNKTKAAGALGISRQMLHKKILQYHLGELPENKEKS